MKESFLSTLTYLVCFATASIGPSHAGAAEVYRTVDNDGNVIFTDVPPKEDRNAQKITVPRTNTAELSGPLPAETFDEPTIKAADFYEFARIISPEDDMTVRENHGNIQVDVEVVPGLRAKDEVRLLLDGIAIQSGRQSGFLLDNVDRGTHTVHLEVIDEYGDVVLVGESTKFHLQRYAILTAPNQDVSVPLPAPVNPPPQVPRPPPR